ncbi:MAG: hypothetical protein K6T80_04800 [Firmicutes bacterium]|nr:hypothetical protein [Bacillota bacterium]
MLISDIIKKIADRLKYLADYAVWGFQSDNIRKFDRIMALERPEIRRIIIRNYSSLQELLANNSRRGAAEPPAGKPAAGRDQLP